MNMPLVRSRPVRLLHRAVGATAAIVVLASIAACEGGDDGRAASGPIDVQVQEITEAGFVNPAAVVVDEVADVYYVSNVNGAAGDRDGNGFISRLSPDGEVLDLRWIDLSGTDRALNSPEGMTVRGDTLFVADLDCIRMYQRASGNDEGFTCLEDVTHITDIDVGPEGSLFIVDSGLGYADGASTRTGTDAVYRLVMTGGQRGSTLARGEELGSPKGIAVGSRGIFVTTSETGEVYRLTPQGERTSIFPASDRALDGIVHLPGGGFAFASRSEGAVFLVTGQGQVVRLMDDLPEAGGLGFDPSRNRLIVPLFSEGTIVFLDMPEGAAEAAPTG